LRSKIWPREFSTGEAPDVELSALQASLSLAPAEFAGGIRALALHFEGVELVNSAAEVECVMRCLDAEDFDKCMRNC
jgi:hypothetical protein